jgi:hypothetical protein
MAGLACLGSVGLGHDSWIEGHRMQISLTWADVLITLGWRPESAHPAGTHAGQAASFWVEPSA